MGTHLTKSSGAPIWIKRALTPDGRKFVGVGVQPDGAASQTVDAVRSGRDAVLERALARWRSVGR